MYKPQPIGVFPGAAGFFLLPSIQEEEKLMPRLLRGYLPDVIPDEWRFFASAINGESEETVLSLLPETPESAYNRFILNPTDDFYKEAKEIASGDVSLLLDAVAWRLNMLDTPPEYTDTTGEVRAFLLATHAYDAFQQNNWNKGLDLLVEAAKTVESISPIFAARLFSEWAATKQMLGDHGEETVHGYKKALSLFESSPFDEAKAELWFQLGTAYQTNANGKKSVLLEAIKCYHEALKVYRKNTNPEEYAMVHMNLALTYLAMPSYDNRASLRTATAIQSLREALRYFQKDTHPELWASATVNLANALQHVKSSHPEDNLWEAVALYEDVLEVRKKEDDPVGYARVMANQGNALSHLGAFSRAVPRLKEASSLFRLHGEHDAAEAVEEILEEIARKQKELHNRESS